MPSGGKSTKVISLGAGNGVASMPVAPDDGQVYSASGENWASTLTQSGNSLYKWSTDTTATNPTTALVKVNNADFSLATEMYVSGSNFNGQDIDAIIATSLSGDFVTLKKYNAPANFVIYRVTGVAVDNGGWFTVPIAVEDSGGGFLSLDNVEYIYQPTGVRNGDAVLNADTSTVDMQFVIDEDGMASDSPTKVPTQQSVKAYVDASVVSSLNYKGGYDAATNTPNLDSSPVGVFVGDFYTVTVAGTFFSVQVEVGDALIAEVDDPATEAGWTICCVT